MHGTIVVSLALALVVTVLVLAREVRVRRALERLLQLILNQWRQRNEKTRDDDPVADPRGNDRV